MKKCISRSPTQSQVTFKGIEYLLSPFHIAALFGNIDQFRPLPDSIINGYPNDNMGNMPLEIAAMNGHLDVCKMIIYRVKGKNPVNDNAFKGAPLHFAALNGNLDVCRLISAYIDKKNSTNSSGETPLHRAAHFGHVDVYRPMMAEVEEKNPADNFNKHQINIDGGTPKMLVANNVEMSKLFES